MAYFEATTRRHYVYYANTTKIASAGRERKPDEQRQRLVAESEIAILSILDILTN